MQAKTDVAFSLLIGHPAEMDGETTAAELAVGD